MKTTTELPVWTLAATVTALVRPQMFTCIQPESIELSIISVLTLIGMNLDISDLKQAAQQPKALATGVGECTLCCRLCTC
jgi:predicted Na+-dependent transporter